MRNNEEQDMHDDLIPRAEVFRSKLIDSFQLLDSLQGMTDIPKYYSSELAESPQIMERMMIEEPHGLVKFKVYSHSEEKKGDRRLNKVRMKSQFGIYCFGPWAKEITENKKFQHFMSALIVLNSLVLGIQGEVMHHDHHVNFMWCLNMFDHISLIIFVFEILLKLIDQPTGFWKNGWNNFDFLITMMTLVIAIIDMADPMKNTKGNLSYIAILKGFRILRSLKMLTRFAQLRLIVLTILKALSSIGVITFLLIIVIYLFAVMGLIFFKDYSNPEKLAKVVLYENRYGTINVTQRFGSFVNSTLIVLQLFTVDSWHTLFKQIEMDNVVPPFYVYLYVIAWLFIGAIMFKNIFVGIMVMNFKTIRDDFIEQCLEREEDLTMGQKGLLLEVELAMQHASATGSVDSMQRTSLECSGQNSGLIPFLSTVSMPSNLSVIDEGNSGSDVSEYSNITKAPAGIPFSETIKPSLSEEEISMQRDALAPGEVTETAASPSRNTIKSDISGLLDTLRETKSMMGDDGEIAKEFPESASWNDTVRWNFQNFEMNKETLWPRDTLFKYIQLMEVLQDNLAERHQLQRLSVRAISNMLDSKY